VTSVLILFAVGLLVWWVFLRPRPVSSENQPKTETPRTILPLESFTVNLADPEEGRFLRTTLALGVDGELPRATKEESKSAQTENVSMATIRDSILSVLTQYKSDDLLTPEGKSKLKTDLLNSLNHDVPALQVHEVYFTEFLVQR
jgi:flagellar FliL protein